MLSTEQGREPPKGGDRINVGASDDSVAKMQLAARWAELYPAGQDESLEATLKRFRRAYEYLDAVTHGIEPPAAAEPEPSSENPG